MAIPRVLLLLSVTCITPASLQNVQISFSAPSLIHAGRDLVLDCRPNLRNANNFGLIRDYVFLFQRENEDIMPLADVIFNFNKGEEVVTWGNDLLESRSTIKHQLGLANVSFAQVFIPEVNCADTAEYTCVMESHRASRNVEVIRNPSEVFPITVTSIERQRMINDNLGIISAALQNVGSTQPSVLPIGSVAVFNCTAFESFPPPTIRWCLRRSTEDIFRNFAYASAQRVDRVNSSFPDRSCFYTTTSLLPFVISDSDNGTTLSCSTNTEECNSRTSGSSNEMTFTIVTSESDRAAEDNSNEDGSEEVIQGEPQSSTAGLTALVTAGVILLIIGVSGMALASITYMKARKIKIEYENLKERERYQTLSDVSGEVGGADPVTYEVLHRQESENMTPNYVNSDYKIHSEAGPPS
uniref:Uncharacterized protein LOC111122521 isoform X1 n=1 Tax=Crassostrea virginica TaxID=6565 RepID=A0A8B8CWJ8_CRAVI|nr:uncharacterized protein LOC111122521 isoform X1 [Crassostrea virginica]